MSKTTKARVAKPEPTSADIIPREITAPIIETPPLQPAPARLMHIAPHQVSPFRYQPRRDFALAELQELADDMKTPDPETGQMRGVLQAIVVRPDKDWIVSPGTSSKRPGFYVMCERWFVGSGNQRTYERPAGYGYEDFYLTEQEAQDAANSKFELVAGERRWRSSILAALEEIPAYVRILSDREALKIAVAENEKRKDVNIIESAASYAKLAELGVPQAQIGAEVGKSQPAVANALRLLELPVEVQRLIEQRELSPSHGIILAGFKMYPAFCIWYAEKIAEAKIPTKTLEKKLVISGYTDQQELEKNGLAKLVDYNAAFSIEAAQRQYPAAFRDGTYGMWCLDLALYKRLEQEGKKAKAEKAARDEAKAKAGQPLDLDNAKTKAGQPLDLDNAHYGAYQDLTHTYTQCALCTEACPCRSIGTKTLRDGVRTVPICIDRKRFEKLQAQEKKEKHLRRKALFAAHDVNLKQLDGTHRQRCLGVAFWKIWIGVGAPTRRTVAAELAPGALRELLEQDRYNIKETAAWPVLTGLDAVELVNLTATLMVRHELRQALENHSDTIAETRYILALDEKPTAPAVSPHSEAPHASEDEADPEPARDGGIMAEMRQSLLDAAERNAKTFEISACRGDAIIRYWVAPLAEGAAGVLLKYQLEIKAGGNVAVGGIEAQASAPWAAFETPWLALSRLQQTATNFYKGEGYNPQARRACENILVKLAAVKSLDTAPEANL